MTPNFGNTTHFCLAATLRAHAGNARTVASRGFSRLPRYFSPDTLTSAKVVQVDQLPIPPLSSWGLTRFADFERGNFDGVTYLNTFFIRQDELGNETIHFHELIHVIQWRFLGPENFLRLYTDGLERFGYRNNPLEMMAYDAEAAFRSNDGRGGNRGSKAELAGLQSRHCPESRRSAAQTDCPAKYQQKDPARDGEAVPGSNSRSGFVSSDRS